MWWLFACASTGPDAPPVPIAVAVAPVERRSLPRVVHGAGRLKSAEEVTLSFASGGVLARIDVAAGDRVRRGQVIAVLDAAAARAQLDGARSALAKAERDFDRAAHLDEAVTRQVVDDAATGLQIARANVDAAEFAVRRSVLVAPADGVVIARFADRDQTLGAGVPVVRLSSDPSWEVEIGVPAADALRIEPGTPATVRIAAFGDEEFHGQVVRGAGGASASGRWSVTVGLDPTDRPLASGLVAAAELAPPTEAVPVVPLSALAEVDGSRAVVYTVDSSVARRVPVEVAWIADDRAALHAPVALERVIVAGAPFLRDGAPVEVAR